MKLDTPLDSKVSYLEPALTATVTEAKGEVYFSDATLMPFDN